MQNSVSQAGPHAHTSSHRVTERWEGDGRGKGGREEVVEKGTNGMNVWPCVWQI